MTRLKIVSEPYRKTMPAGHTRIVVACICECGNTSTVVKADVLAERVRSCGCLQKEAAKKLNRSHGQYATRLYRTWADMKSRCCNPKDTGYANYGGRGIAVSKEWLVFENFFHDMSASWEKNKILDRVDPDGNYCKENCRWVDASESVHNKRKLQGCSSSFMGVSFCADKKKKPWQARISRNRTVILIGRFPTEQEAALAYDNMSEKLYGDRPNKTIKE